jgi:hypothetical protein
MYTESTTVYNEQETLILRMRHDNYVVPVEALSRWKNP